MLVQAAASGFAETLDGEAEIPMDVDAVVELCDMGIWTVVGVVLGFGIAAVVPEVTVMNLVIDDVTVVVVVDIDVLL